MTGKVTVTSTCGGPCQFDRCTDGLTRMVKVELRQGVSNKTTAPKFVKQYLARCGRCGRRKWVAESSLPRPAGRPK